MYIDETDNEYNDVPMTRDFVQLFGESNWRSKFEGFQRQQFYDDWIYNFLCIYVFIFCFQIVFEILLFFSFSKSMHEFLFLLALVKRKDNRRIQEFMMFCDFPSRIKGWEEGVIDLYSSIYVNSEYMFSNLQTNQGHKTKRGHGIAIQLFN